MKIRFLSAQVPSLIGLKRLGIIVRKELHLAWRKDTTYQSTKRYTLVSDLCLGSDSPNDRYSYVFSTVAVGPVSRAFRRIAITYRLHWYESPRSSNLRQTFVDSWWYSPLPSAW